MSFAVYSALAFGRVDWRGGGILGMAYFFFPFFEVSLGQSPWSDGRPIVTCRPC